MNPSLHRKRYYVLLMIPFLFLSSLFGKHVGEALTYSTVIKIANSDVAGKIELRPSFTTEGSTSLYTTLSRSETIVLIVMDVMGRQLWSGSVRPGKGENYTPLNLSRLSKGIYYVHVASADGVSISKTLPFIKN